MTLNKTTRKEKFYQKIKECFICGSPLNLALYAGEKIVTVGHNNQIILKKNLGAKPMPSLPMFKINRSLHDMIHKTRHNYQTKNGIQITIFV